VQERTSFDTELVEDIESGAKGEKEVSTANILVSTAGQEDSTARHEVSTSAESLVYIRRSVEKRKDKGKAIMQETKPPKQIKKMVQVQLRDIDWSDPSVSRYHALKNRPVSVAQARKNMIRYLMNQGGFKLRQFKGMNYEDIRPLFEKKDVGKTGRRRKTISRKRTSKNQNVVSSKRQKHDKDVDYEQEKGDLRMIFDPDEKDDIWMNQPDWKLERWKLHERCGVHSLFMSDRPMEINMLVEKRYPLKKELLEKMLNLQLEAEEESTIAFELLKFIKSQVEE
ncbi:hypothetical protein Tco_1422771, partial [Tanacetum coccineum]